MQNHVSLSFFMSRWDLVLKEGYNNCTVRFTSHSINPMPGVTLHETKLSGLHHDIVAFTRHWCFRHGLRTFFGPPLKDEWKMYEVYIDFNVLCETYHVTNQCFFITIASKIEADSVICSYILVGLHVLFLRSNIVYLTMRNIIMCIFVCMCVCVYVCMCLYICKSVCMCIDLLCLVI